jgi:hypothetical protein
MVQLVRLKADLCSFVIFYVGTLLSIGAPGLLCGPVDEVALVDCTFGRLICDTDVVNARVHVYTRVGFIYS